jgi:transcriptional regulator with XRE-family HTH domain
MREAERRGEMTETSPGGGPTVLRMILGRQLQALREKAGLSYDQAAEAIYSSSYTVRRMERAEGGLKPLTVKSLLMAYGITDVREIDAFLALARDASKPGWWHSYNDILPTWFRTLIGLEEAASLIRGYDPQSIPGLLQTPDYARASVATGFPDATSEETARRVELRLARQHILSRPDPPRLWLVIDETALRRPAATTGPEVMRAQLDALIHAAQRPSITLQVLPFTAGLHPAMYGPFRIFRFDTSEQPDIVYGESMTSAWYLDKPDETALYTQALDRISAQATPAASTVKVLRQIRKEM